MGRRRRLGYYRKRDQTPDHADTAVAETEPIIADPETVASVVADIVAAGRPVEVTPEEIEQRELDQFLRDEARLAREQREREARDRARAEFEARQLQTAREAALRESRERFAQQQAKRQADDHRHQVGELRRRTAQQGIEWNAFKVGVQRQTTSQNIDRIFSEMAAIVNPPRDLNAERIAELEQRAAAFEEERLDAADPQGAILRAIGRSWWG
jgi:hypothetical protein